MEIARKHDLMLIEDCSQAHLATCHERFVGSFGRIATFSFYPSKNLGAFGEAGAVLTNDPTLYEKMLAFRQHGSVRKYLHELEGHNYRMDELQGAVLRVKLKHLEGWTEKRRRAASLYREALRDQENIKLPLDRECHRHVYHLFVIRARRRNELQTFLREKGVETGIHYPVPLHLQKAYERLGYRQGSFPVAEKCCGELLSLPMFPEITESQIAYVAEMIDLFYRSVL